MLGFSRRRPGIAQHDPYGDEAVAGRLFAALPDAPLELLPGAGHPCWLDDLGPAADVVRSHLLTDVPTSTA